MRLPLAGRDVGRLLLDADAEELTQTRNAQLTTFVLSLVVLDAIERLGIDPRYRRPQPRRVHRARRHRRSVLRRRRRLVTERARPCRTPADEPGTMAAVLGLDDEQVEVACRRADGDVWVANYNAPGQVVIAGCDGSPRPSEIAKELGAKKVLPLPVSGAFHTPFMAPARDVCARQSTSGTPRPDVPVVANVDALPHDDRRVARPVVGPTLQPGALAAEPATLDDRG